MASWALLFALAPAFAAQREAVVPALPQALPAVAPVVPALPSLAVQAVTALPTASSALEAIAAPIARNQPLSQQAQAANVAMDGRGAKPVSSDPIAVEVPQAAVPRDGGGARLYVLSKTVDRTAKIGPVWQGIHYGGEAAFQVGKMILAYKVGGWGGVAAVTLLEAPRYPLSVAGQSLLHLAINQSRERLRFLRELAKSPGVTGLKVLTGSEVEFAGVMAKRQVGHSLVLMEATEKPVVDPSFGEALPVTDPARTRIRLKLSFGGESHELEWRPSLADVLAGAPAPAAIASAWTAALAQRLASEGWIRRLLFSRVKKRLTIEAALISPSGEERELGVLARGRAAVRLAKGRKGVPLIETRVRKTASRGGPGRWLDALLGREIVVP